MKEQYEEQYLTLINDLHTKAMNLSDEAFYANKKQSVTLEKVRELYLEARGVKINYPVSSKILSFLGCFSTFCSTFKWF